MRADVDVDEPRPEARSLAELVREQADRALERVRMRPREVHEVGGVDRDGPDVELDHPLSERRQFGRRVRPAFPGRRVVGEDLQRASADRVGTLDRLHHAAGEGQVRTESATVGKHGMHRTMAPMDPIGPEDAAFEARVIRSFIRDGRLTTIPARERRRQVIYRYLRDQVFTEDRAYPEKEVNQRLAMYHADVATIRRGMVDAGLVTRDGGEYRRGS